MGATKTDVFDDRVNRLASVAKAMGHPARIAILTQIMTQKSCINKDLVEELPLAQPTISQHLKELKRAGLIAGSIDENRMCYCIDRDGLKEIMQYCQELIAESPADDQCC